MAVLKSLTGALIGSQLTVIWTLSIADGVTVTYHFLPMENYVVVFGLTTPVPYSVVIASDITGSYTIDVPDNHYVYVKCTTADTPDGLDLASFRQSEKEKHKHHSHDHEILENTEKIRKDTKKILDILYLKTKK